MLVWLREICIGRLRSLKLGFTTWPDRRAWLYCGALLVAFLAMAAAIGLLPGIFQFELIRSKPWPVLLFTGLMLFVRPSLLEEVLFRGILLPHPTQVLPRSRKMLWAAASLAAYVLAHPLTALVTGLDEYAVFMRPAFLCVVFALGLANTLAYFLSGSLWPAVFIHWVALLVWALLFGGYHLFPWL